MKKYYTIELLSFVPTIAAGVFLLFSAVDIQGMLLTGDHGRDLYAFERTLGGDMPYKDYWWVYGPLMPFYYALFMKLFGINILSVLIGKACLKFAAGLFIYIAIRRIANPVAAMCGAIWFYLFSQEFFFTYNHMGGILAITMTAAALMSYIKTRQSSYLWAAAFISFILCFIKLNFGLAGLLICAICSFVTDRLYNVKTSSAKKSFYLVSLVILPIITAIVYMYLLKGLPVYEIRQCLPYSNSDQPYNIMPSTAMALLWNMVIQNILSNGINLIFACMVIITFVRIIYLALTKKISMKEDLRYFAALLVLGIYFILNLHEFLKSGVDYRSLWSQPIGFIFIFISISLAIRQSGRAWRSIVWFCIAVLAFIGWLSHENFTKQVHRPDQYLADDKAQVFVINKPDWINTVEETTAFLRKNLKPEEQFLALPYDAIYYYLTGRKSPTQLLIFFEHINIPVEQENRTIQDLEKASVNWIVISSRMKAREPGLGTLGATYCPVIGQYIKDNFELVARFGDWQHEPGWGWNHGTAVFKRKSAHI